MLISRGPGIAKKGPWSRSVSQLRDQLLDRRPSNHPAVHLGRIHRACAFFGSLYGVCEIVSTPRLLLLSVSSGLPLRRPLPCHIGLSNEPRHDEVPGRAAKCPIAIMPPAHATGGFISLFGITVMLAGLPNSTDLDQGFCEGAAKRREPVINS